MFLDGLYRRRRNRRGVSASGHLIAQFHIIGVAFPFLCVHIIESQKRIASTTVISVVVVA